MAEQCSLPQECKYVGTENCIQTIHHLYWPKKDYKTRVERDFRELPDNKVLLPRCTHDLVHLLEPPEKPSRDEMLQALGQGALDGELGTSL